MRRRPARRYDANHRTISDALEAVGAMVVDLAVVGDGCPDILVGFRGRWVAMEIKDGTRIASERKLTHPEEHFFQRAAARALPCFVVESIEDAIRALTAPARAA